MSDTYDRILTWNEDGRMCETCMGVGTNNHCREWLDELKKYDSDICTCYANAFQLKGLIEEAIERYRKKPNNLLICTNLNPCPGCLASKFHTLMRDPDGCYDPEPFRGTKGEEQTWPGINGETHKEALKEIAGKENEDGGDCSEVENRHKWNADGKGCETCVNNKPCNISANYCGGFGKYDLYERKEDRSDTEYNKDREFLRVKAGEMAEDDVEYVVSRRDFTMKEMASTSIDGDIFKYLFNKFGVNWGWTKGVNFIDAKNVSPETIPELLRMGFIERKVEDPVVNLGDCFKCDAGIFMAVWNGPHKQTLCRISDSAWGYRQGAHLIDCCIDGNPEKETFSCKLSDLVGKDRLSEFKKVNVEIREVD